MIFFTKNLIYERYIPRIILGEYSDSNPELDISVTASTTHKLSLLQDAMVSLSHILKL